MLSLTSFIGIALAVFASGFIRGLAGFAMALTAIPLLVLFIDIRIVVPLVVLLATTATLFLLFQLRKNLRWKDVFPLIIGFAPGTLIGTFFLKTLNPVILQWILGIVLISYSSYSLFLKLPQLNIKRGWGYIFGFIAGTLRGAIGAGGPPIIIYTSLQPWSKDKIKVSIQAFYIISAPLTILIQASAGLITLKVLKYYLIALPIFALGTFLGSRLYGVIRERSYKTIFFVLLGLIGALIIYKTL
jgi:uncharacterized membrane protein YfcA